MVSSVVLGFYFPIPLPHVREEDRALQSKRLVERVCLRDKASVYGTGGHVGRGGGGGWFDLCSLTAHPLFSSDYF